MEKQNIEKRNTHSIQHRAYFQSETHISLETTDIKKLLDKMIYEILNKIATYEKNGIGWYFKEVLILEIHTVDYKSI